MTNRKDKHITDFITDQPELQTWLRDFSAHLNAEAEESNLVVQLPEAFAKGFAKVFEIEKGLTYRMVNYRLNTDFHYKKEAVDKFYLILYFYQYSDCSSLYYKINDTIIVDINDERYSSLLMTNSQATQELILSTGTYVEGLTIQITEEWLQDKIAHPRTANYEIFKERNIFQTFLNPKSQKLLNEIFAKDIPSNVPELYLNNRILRLLENFLEKILNSGIYENTLPSSDSDVQNLLRIESYLLENYTSEFPSVDVLAKRAYMSATKLKSLFKKAFGVGMYEYYQKNRIHKAKELLNSGDYSVTEVGEMIGYKNLSNFSLAFKKEFGFLPKHFDKIR